MEVINASNARAIVGIVIVILIADRVILDFICFWEDA